tara:strand:- start:48 stop:434 length:387 start_codon:yes stop_codon:yes gene_type:complete
MATSENSIRNTSANQRLKEDSLEAQIRERDVEIASLKNYIEDEPIGDIPQATLEARMESLQKNVARLRAMKTKQNQRQKTATSLMSKDTQDLPEYTKGKPELSPSESLVRIVRGILPPHLTQSKDEII